MIELEYVPALHKVQVDEPAVPYVPARQPMQAVLDVAPTVVDDVPVAQLMQTVDADAAVPTCDEYVPALHCVHVVEAASAQVPALHAMQVALLEAPTAAEKRPAEQLRQTVDTDAAAPTVDEYLPATHDVHVVVPAEVQVPLLQAVQVVDETAATADEYVPAAQLRQIVETDAAVPIDDE